MKHDRMLKLYPPEDGYDYGTWLDVDMETIEVLAATGFDYDVSYPNGIGEPEYPDELDDFTDPDTADVCTSDPRVVDFLLSCGETPSWGDGAQDGALYDTTEKLKTALSTIEPESPIEDAIEDAVEIAGSRSDDLTSRETAR